METTMADTTIDLAAALRGYKADPDGDWEIIPVEAIGSDGQPVIAWYSVKELGPIPEGHVMVFNDKGGWVFKPVRTN
jgi:hypothetical protein